MARTPEVNISLSASTSEVTRVTRRPTGLRSKKATCLELDVAEDLAAEIEHDLLAGPLHEVGLDEGEDEAEDVGEEVERGEFGDAGIGVDGEVTGEPGLGGLGAGVGRHVGVDARFEEERADDLGERNEEDGDGGKRDLRLVRGEIGEETAHQAAVVNLADDIVVLFGRIVAHRWTSV